MSSLLSLFHQVWAKEPVGRWSHASDVSVTTAPTCIRIQSIPTIYPHIIPRPWVMHLLDPRSKIPGLSPLSGQGSRLPHSPQTSISHFPSPSGPSRAHPVNIGSSLKHSARPFLPVLPEISQEHDESGAFGWWHSACRRRKHPACFLCEAVVRAVRPRLGGGTGSLARDMQVGNFLSVRWWCGLFQMQCSALLRCTVSVRCWDCISWDFVLWCLQCEASADRHAMHLGLELRKTGNSYKYNTTRSAMRGNRALYDGFYDPFFRPVAFDVW